MVIPQLSKLLLGVRFSLPANGKFKKNALRISEGVLVKKYNFI